VRVGAETAPACPLPGPGHIQHQPAIRNGPMPLPAPAELICHCRWGPAAASGAAERQRQSLQAAGGRVPRPPLPCRSRRRRSDGLRMSLEGLQELRRCLRTKKGYASAGGLPAGASSSPIPRAAPPPAGSRSRPSCTPAQHHTTKLLCRLDAAGRQGEGREGGTRSQERAGRGAAGPAAETRGGRGVSPEQY